MVFFREDGELNPLGQELLGQLEQRFSHFNREDLALTWLVYDPPVIVNTGGALSQEEFWKHRVRGFQHQGDRPLPPGQLAQLMYLLAIEDWLENAMVPPSPELERAIVQMTTTGSHDATGLIVDTLTGTTSGPTLAPGPWDTWKQQRNFVNRYFQSLQWPELAGININQKTWSDQPYGREKQLWGDRGEHQNRLTTNAVAKVFHSIVGGVAVSPGRSQTMMDLLSQSLEFPAGHRGFFGEGLSSPVKLWSKTSVTRQGRQEVAYVELPYLQQPYILAVFLDHPLHSQNPDIFPFIARWVRDTMGQL